VLLEARLFLDIADSFLCLETECCWLLCELWGEDGIAGYVLYASWLYVPISDAEGYKPVVKTITGYWSHAKFYGLTIKEEDKNC
jgi:hypothetical protein